MKNLKIAVTSILFACALTSIAQEKKESITETNQNKKWTTSSVSVLTNNNFIITDMNFSIKDFYANTQKLGGIYLNNDRIEFGDTLNSFNGGSSKLQGYPSIYFQASFKNKEKLNDGLRVGLGFLTIDHNLSFYKSTNLGGDSVSTKSVYYTAKTRSISADLCYLYSTEKDKRVSLFIGIGMNMNVSYNSTFFRDELQTIYKQDSTGRRLPLDYLERNYNEFSLKPSLGLRPFIPIGFDIRFAKTKPVLKNLNLHTELQAGLIVQKFINGNIKMGRLSSLAIGIKYNINS